MSRKELLFSITKKDLDIQTFCSGGPGGQHQNKTESGVRIVHRASGAVGESRSERSQHQNKRIALKRLTESVKFKLWTTRISFEIASGKTAEQRVDEMMNQKNIKIDIHDEKGRWRQLEDGMVLSA